MIMKPFTIILFFLSIQVAKTHYLNGEYIVAIITMAIWIITMAYVFPIFNKKRVKK